MTSLPLWLTTESNCSYFDDRRAQSIVIDPAFDMDTTTYDRLLEQGFRRSGDQVYRPHCPNCRACVPTRIPVAAFRANRKQRRCANRNIHTQVVVKPAIFDARHFDLYRRYLTERHDASSESPTSRSEYLQFFGSRWCETWFVEFLIGGELAAVAVVDVLDDALSAVYTFFDPKFNYYSPGVLAVLWQIDEAKRRNLPYVYLGFWIGDCRKMSYKIQYQPLQGLIEGQWRPILNHQTYEE